MTNPLAGDVRPDVLNEDKTTINSFLKDSYNHARKQLEGGVSFFREEFFAIYDKTGHYLNKMVLPVNNFLKDLSQIEAELRQELGKESPEMICLNGEMVPVEHVLLLTSMEENY
ncbi:MAG: hypothetical protein ABIR30_04145 [Chitinophagaceae bacterium]